MKHISRDMSDFHHCIVFISVATTVKIYSQHGKEYMSLRVREAAPSLFNYCDIASPLPHLSTNNVKHIEVEIERHTIQRHRRG